MSDIQGELIRSVTMSYAGKDREARVSVVPAGSLVWVDQIKDDGTCRVRLICSALEQRVRLSSTVKPV